MTIEQRVEKLEQENRRLRVFVGAALLIGCAVAVMGASGGVPEVLQAKRFEVVGGNGQAVAHLGQTMTGGYLQILDFRGKTAAQVNSNPTGGAVLTYSASGSELVGMTSTPQGSGVVTTYDAAGQKLIALTVTVEGGGAVATFKSDGDVKSVWP
jgi:hypothetical protein